MVHAELESIQGEHLDEMAFALLTSELKSFQIVADTRVLQLTEML